MLLGNAQLLKTALPEYSQALVERLAQAYEIVREHIHREHIHIAVANAST